MPIKSIGKTLIITDDELDHLNKLVERSGLKSIDALVNTSLTVIEWVLDTKDEGHVVASVDEAEDTYAPLVIPGFLEQE